MCEPITIAAGSAMLLGGGLKAAGEYQSGQYDAAQAGRNRQLALTSAADAQARGALQAGQIQQRGSQMIGQQRAAFGASGVDPSTGSAADLQGDTRAMATLDAETAKLNAAREAWGFQVQAINYGQQAQLAKQRGVTQAIGSLLGTASQAIGGFGGKAG